MLIEAGTIWGHHDEGFHYLVLRNTQEYVWVKPDDVIPRCRCFDMELQKGLGWLQWRKEQSCRFFDSKGEERHYYIQFPLQFLHSAEEKRRWPLLLYLHGVGGCSFFTHTKKSLKSPGMHHAAKHFIVVSPHCTWGWRDRPLTWVHELIAELRAASYVDDTRIYMAGNSMGGMGTWYLASERPDLYAAIALVSAYHHEGGLETIPEALLLAVLEMGTCVYEGCGISEEACRCYALDDRLDLQRRAVLLGAGLADALAASHSARHAGGGRVWCDRCISVSGGGVWAMVDVAGSDGVQTWRRMCGLVGCDVGSDACVG